MAGAAAEGNRGAALSGDGLDHAKSEASVFQDGALLDVEFEIAAGVRMERWLFRFWVGCGVVSQRRCHEDARRVLARQMSRTERAGERAAADEGHSIAHTLFVRKADDLDSKLQPPSLQRLDQRETEHHAEDAVVLPGIGHGVEMRREDETWSRCGFVSGRVVPTQISHAI